MDKKKVIRYTGSIFCIAGFILIGVVSSWWVSIGILILITGNNMERS